MLLGGPGIITAASAGKPSVKLDLSSIKRTWQAMQVVLDYLAHEIRKGELASLESVKALAAQAQGLMAPPYLHHIGAGLRDGGGPMDVGAAAFGERLGLLLAGLSRRPRVEAALADEAERLSDWIEAHIRPLHAHAWVEYPLPGGPVECQTESRREARMEESPDQHLRWAVERLAGVLPRTDLISLAEDARQRLAGKWNDHRELLAAVDFQRATTFLPFARGPTATAAEYEAAINRDLTLVRESLSEAEAALKAGAGVGLAKEGIATLDVLLVRAHRCANQICLVFMPGGFDAPALKAEMKSLAVAFQDIHNELIAVERRRQREMQNTPSAAKSPDVIERFVFRREGAHWRVVFDGVGGTFDDTLGMRYLATLLARAGATKPISALELVGSPSSGASGTHTSQPVLDPTAKAEYQDDLARLQNAIEEARASGDEPKQVRLQTELGEVVADLKAATGLGGRDRTLGAKNPAESARASVGQALRRAYDGFRNATPPLGALADHLKGSITVNSACYAYHPPSPPPNWQL